MDNRKYKGEAPGDTPIQNKPGRDSHIEDPILKVIVLQVFPLIIAVFIIIMFLIVCISGITLVTKSLYLYRIRPWTRKKIKIYKRYKKKLHTDEANSSSSSESDDSDAIATEILDKFEAEINRKNTVSSVMNPGAFMPRVSISIPTNDQNSSQGGQSTSVLKKQPSQTNTKTQVSGSRSHLRSHHSNRHRRRSQTRRNDPGPSQSSFVPLQLMSETSVLNTFPLTTVKKPVRVKRMAPAPLMPEGYKHLRRDTEGPLQYYQKALQASPDFKSYDPVNEVWESSSTDDDWPRNIILIPRKRLNKKRRN